MVAGQARSPGHRSRPGQVKSGQVRARSRQVKVKSGEGQVKVKAV